MTERSRSLALRGLPLCAAALLITPFIASAQVATLNASPTAGLAPLNVTFTGEVNGAQYDGGVQLQFGDGATTTVCSSNSSCSGSFSITHDYTGDGAYTPAVVGIGDTATSTTLLATATVTVGDQTSTSTSATSTTSAVFSALPSSGAAPLDVCFTASEALLAPITIDYGDSNPGPQNLGCSDSIGAHTYSIPGSYTATLTDGNDNVYSTTVTVTSGTTTATSSPDIQDQIAALLSLIQQLEAQIAQLTTGTSTPPVVSPPPTPGSACLDLTYNLAVGSTDADSSGEVSQLQQFLGLSTVTGYFGPQTQQALQQWQADHAIVSSGSPSTTGWGYLGPRTRLAMHCQTNPTPVSTGPLEATPSSGVAPLSVTFSSAATGALTVSFGDGSSAALPANQCTTPSPSMTSCTPASVTHVYQSPGAYIASLIQTTGGTYCPLSYNINNPLTFLNLGSGSCVGTAPVSTTIATTTVLVSAAPVPAPVASLTATPASGAAPLLVSFTGAFSGPGLGASYTLDFGDNSTPTTGGIASMSTTSIAATHTYSAAGIYTATLEDSSDAATASTTVTVAAAPAATSTTVALYQCPMEEDGQEVTSVNGREANFTACSPVSTCTGQSATSSTCTYYTSPGYQQACVPTTVSCTFLGNLNQ